MILYLDTFFGERLINIGEQLFEIGERLFEITASPFLVSDNHTFHALCPGKTAKSKILQKSEVKFAKEEVITQDMVIISECHFLYTIKSH